MTVTQFEQDEADGGYAEQANQLRHHIRLQISERTVSGGMSTQTIVKRVWCCVNMFWFAWFPNQTCFGCTAVQKHDRQRYADRALQ